MRVGVFGKGKTGSKVIELLPSNEIIHVFDRANPVTLEKLEEIDIVIAFVTAGPFMDAVDILLESKVYVVSGVTGLDYSDELKESVKTAQTKWMLGSNFALGMRVVYRLMKQMNNAYKKLPFDAHIHEVHHTQKLDRPSGTALSWKKWLDMEDISISDDRQGDVVGFHELTSWAPSKEKPNEEIVITHKALGREVFAQGAIWAARKLLDDRSLAYGAYHFEEYADHYLENTL